MNFIQRVKKTILQYDLIRHGDSVLVAVSGGEDSVSLLHVLYQLRYELGLKLSVAHVNHQLRRGSDTDQRFVERLCDDLRLSCCTIKLTIPRPRQKGSLEEIAREHRFNGLIRLAKKRKVDSIALAHHQDDLAETVLMRILRGTGLLGLQGILPKRSMKGCSLIRPLIEMSRKDITRFLKKSGIPFRVDPTNKQTRFFRNKIRLELLPFLEKQYQRNIKEILAHLSDNVAHDYDFLREEGQKILRASKRKSGRSNRIQIPLKSLSGLHPGLVRMVLRLAIDELQGNMNRITLSHLKEIEDLITHRPPGSIVHLPAGVGIMKERTRPVLTLRKT